METIKIKEWGVLLENYTGIVEYPSGTLRYYLNGKLHREDGPAVIYPDGRICYYLNGKYHREDGPAIIRTDGTIEYYLNDKEITKEVNNWIEENNIPKVWTNSHKILFKLTFG